MNHVVLDEKEKILNTIALAMKDKDELHIIWLYFKGYSPSVIARFLGGKTYNIRTIVNKNKGRVDEDLVLTRFEDLYALPSALDNGKCIFCGRPISKPDVFRHLKERHRSELEVVAQKLLGGGSV